MRGDRDCVVVPSGLYSLGSAASEDETPVTRIELTAFAIDRLPVSNGDFQAFVNSGGYENPSYWTAGGWAFIEERGFREPSCWADPIWGRRDYPVTGISWWEATAYAVFQGLALPTEAQWEAACKGPRNCTYPWGEQEPSAELANYAPAARAREGVRRPVSWDLNADNVSWCGARLMAGNLAEWCLDTYIGYYPFTDGERDPCHIQNEHLDHVTRGGSSIHPEDFLRCAARDPYPPGVRDNFLGFRCVHTDHVLSDPPRDL